MLHSSAYITKRKGIESEITLFMKMYLIVHERCSLFVYAFKWIWFV